MALSEIENQLDAGHIVLRHAPGRAVKSVVILLTCIVALLFTLRPAGTLWGDAFGGLVGALAYTDEVLIAAYLAYTCFIVVVQTVRGIPLLEASEGGIAINSSWGPMFVHWRDVAELSAGVFVRRLRIRLREGARPDASTWTRIMNASWGDNSVGVSAVTAVAHPIEIVEGLSALRERYGAAEWGEFETSYELP